MDKGLFFGLTAVDPSDYRGWSGACPGCDLDASRMASRMIQEGVFAVEYHNQSATRDVFLRDFKRTAQSMTPGSMLIVFVSCHGGQVPDLDGDEEDGYDETICLWDGQLVDDLIRDALAEVPSSINIIFITDTCNSGSNFRLHPRSYRRAVPIIFTGSLIHFGGCEDGKSSYGDDDDGGVFTNALLKTFDPQLTPREWFSAAAKLMPRNQIPVYEEFGFVDKFKHSPMFPRPEEPKTEEERAPMKKTPWYKRLFRSLFAACALAAVCGCTTIPFIDRDAPELKVGRTLAGYGRVNAWATDKDTLIEDIKACDEHGVDIYHIEFLSWSRYSPYNKPDVMKKTEECYKAAIKECRKRGIWLFVSFANSNTGSGKYGDAKVPLSKMGDLIEWGIKVVKAEGKDNVLFQPMGETGGSFNTALEARLANEFGQAGFILVNNRGSRPSSKPGWAKWNAWHPFKTSDSVPGDQIIVSDTGMIIQQLCYGLEGKGKPDTAKAWAKSLKDKGVPAVVFYHFKYPEHDEKVIEAMGDAVK